MNEHKITQDVEEQKALLMAKAREAFNYKTIIIKNPQCDSDDVRWQKPDGSEVGYGYFNRDTKYISLMRCPCCNRENYAMNVSSGMCTWCPYKANGEPSWD